MTGKLESEKFEYKGDISSPRSQVKVIGSGFEDGGE